MLVRTNAGEALGIMGPAAKSQIPALISALNDKEPLMVATAAGALGNMGETAQQAVPALKPLAESKDESLRAVVKEAIEKITNPKKPAVR